MSTANTANTTAPAAAAPLVSSKTLRSVDESYINARKGAPLTRQSLDTIEMLNAIRKADPSITSILMADPTALYIAVEGLIHDRKFDTCDAIAVFHYQKEFLRQLDEFTSVQTLEYLIEPEHRAIDPAYYQVPQALLNKFAAMKDGRTESDLHDSEEYYSDLLRWGRCAAEEEESDYSYDSEYSMDEYGYDYDYSAYWSDSRE